MSFGRKLSRYGFSHAVTCPHAGTHEGCHCEILDGPDGSVLLRTKKSTFYRGPLEFPADESAGITLEGAGSCRRLLDVDGVPMDFGDETFVWLKPGKNRSAWALHYSSNSYE